MFKIGSQLFVSEGPRAVERIAALGANTFLDLKFHDIPNTVAGAVAAAASLPGVRLLDVHATGGLAMMRSARQALKLMCAGGRQSPKLLAVTILTSLDARAQRQVGFVGPTERRVTKLASLARLAGLDGVVASPHEAASVRRAFGQKFLIVVPGIRLLGRTSVGRKNDQARVATPWKAIRAGADYIVVGRPITAAPDPAAAAAAILEEISRAERPKV